MRRVFLLPLLFILAACADPADPADKSLRVTILQFGDVYEITPVEGGRYGGLARLATLRQQLLEDNPRTLTLLVGDFFSPSAIGTAKVDGKRLAGKQMVDVLNRVGVDYATFGNHEFDLSESDFQERLLESKFRWISSNVTDARGAAFPGVLESQILRYEEGDKELRIGLFAVTLDANPRSYVSYGDVLTAAKKQVAALAPRVDVLIALTHLSIEQDTELAKALPEIDLIIGGHEHENILLRRGKTFTPIVKGDANVRSVYVHELSFDLASRQHALDTRFVVLDKRIPEDPKVKARAEEWVEKAFAGFRASGFQPERSVAWVTEALDGREASVRNQPSFLGGLITAAMLKEWKEAELAIFNTGSIRIDDVIPPGPISEYDVIRILPFGGETASIEISGALLRQVFEAGLKNRGNGGYLQYAGASRDAKRGWLVNGEPLEDRGTYRAVIAGFLLKGTELNLGFLKRGVAGLKVVEEHRDIRKAFIEELRRRYPSQK